MLTQVRRGVLNGIRESYSFFRCRFHRRLNSQTPDSAQYPIYTVALTGGPCSGKTTALSQIADRMQSIGWKTMCVPEMATLLLTGTGVNYGQLTEEQAYHFQVSMMRGMLCLEDRFQEVARTVQQPTVVLCDRGLMDCAAYISPRTWQRILAENKWHNVELRDYRYDLVVHMVTAAKGAEEFYTTANNPTRHETPEQAREVDERILDVWSGHPYVNVVENTVEFNQKIDLAVAAVSERIGALPFSMRRRTFLVSQASLDNFTVPYHDFDIEYDFVTRGDMESGTGEVNMVRKRGEHGSFAYTLISCQPGQTSDKPVVLRRSLPSREYGALMAFRRPDYATVRKQRHSFIYRSQHMELDTVLSPVSDLKLLNVYGGSASKINIPPFVDVVREVTDDPACTLVGLARLPDAPVVAASISAIFA